MNSRNLFFPLILGISTSLSAEAVSVSYGMGEATSHNRIHACVMAENKALKDALINFSERQFTATNQTVCEDSESHAYCNYIREIDSSTSGTIRQVLDRIRRTKDTTCFIEVKVEIEPAIQLPAEVSSERFYKEGDSISVDVDVNAPLYLHVFNLHENGVDTLFPNDYTSDTLIDDRFNFPPKGVRMIASTNGEAESRETLLFLFTKRRQSIDTHFLRTNKDALKDLLESIPVNEKKLITHNIVIRSK